MKPCHHNKYVKKAYLGGWGEGRNVSPAINVCKLVAEKGKK